MINSNIRQMTRIEYIMKYASLVIEVCKNTAFFPSVMMAQALLESSSKEGIPGASLLASKYNNHFGIKARINWKGRKVALSTEEFMNGAMIAVKAWFRVYENAYQSFADRLQVILRNPRYRNGGVFKASSANEQAQAIQRSGYATDPNYAAKLIAIIRKHKLEDLDKDVRTESPEPTTNGQCP
ncbi:glucosaminidase domain-containing protein [Chryseolinea sp. T2]|uniref:glycoside hydrolase family 73 protein n=1 Tax=Chryseolinea sp. T2 TaxID=3129255 RepID=UPI003076C954